MFSENQIEEKESFHAALFQALFYLAALAERAAFELENVS
jgi:hypothetical protein